MSVDVSSVLYSIIGEIGREKIRSDIASDISLSEKYCEEIIHRCKSALGKDANPETLASACEGLLHFMITAALLPSQRRLAVRGIALDVVIPSARVLATDPEKSLVIQVIKGDSDMPKISGAESVQPVRSNIWLVSAGVIATSYRNYNLDTDGSYSLLVRDIHDFVTGKGISGLKLLPGE